MEWLLLALPIALLAGRHLRRGYKVRQLLREYDPY